jgi:hypothetical protein
MMRRACASSFPTGLLWAGLLWAGVLMVGCSSAAKDEPAASAPNAEAVAIVGLRNESEATLRVRFWIAPPAEKAGERVPAWAFEETRQAAVNPGAVVGYRVKKPTGADGVAAPDPLVRVQIDPVPALATGSLWFELEAPGPYVVVASGTSARLTLARSDGRALKPLTAEAEVGPAAEGAK